MIDIIQKATRTKKIVGYDGRNIIPLNITCLRKTLNPEQLSVIGDRYFCFTSNYNFVNVLSYTKPKFWLHCYRNSSIFNNAPDYLMSESDFVDPKFFPSNKNKSKIYDYIYFTNNDYPSAYNYKGFDVFLKILPILNEMKLKGCILSYTDSSPKWKIPFSPEELNLLKNSNIEIIFKHMNHSELAKTISKCRFAIFPNKNDCSPRMIPECFLNNVPVLVNYDILGGWKYVEENHLLGSTFKVDDLSSVKLGVGKTISLPPNQCEQWMKKYGFMNSSKRLADIIKMYISIPSSITHVYFEEFSGIFSR